MFFVTFKVRLNSTKSYDDETIQKRLISQNLRLKYLERIDRIYFFYPELNYRPESIVKQRVTLH